MTILCNLDGSLSWQPERAHQSASVGRICAWGGFVIAEISSEVPEGERDEYARKFSMVEDLESALDDCVKDLVAYQIKARHAAKTNDRWEGVAETIQPRIDAGRRALARTRGEL